MANENNATAGETAGNNNSDTSTDNKNEGGQNQSNTSTDAKQNEGANGAASPKTFTQEEVNAFLAKERKETERKAKMSEDERLKSDLEDARKQLRERDTKDAVQTEAGRIGAKNGGLIYKAVKDEITFGSDGKPENIKEVLAQAKKDFPELFAGKTNGSADGGEGKTPAQNNSLDNQIRQALGLN